MRRIASYSHQPLDLVRVYQAALVVNIIERLDEEASRVNATDEAKSDCHKVPEITI